MKSICYRNSRVNGTLNIDIYSPFFFKSKNIVLLDSFIISSGINFLDNIPFCQCQSQRDMED